MAELFDWAFSLGVSTGPALIQTGKIAVETYDLTSITIPGGGEADIGILPASGEVAFLAITASKYQNVDESAIPPTVTQIITYQLGDAGDPKVLDAPITLFGPGAAALFPEAWSSLKFKNTSPNPMDAVVIKVLIGRNA